MSTAFTASHPLRFAHCDPAGIAYYPRYLELADAVIEDWTAHVVGVSRRVLHLALGMALPTVALATRFEAVGRLGDILDFALTVDRIGTSSIDLAMAVTCDAAPRFTAHYTQVLVEAARMTSRPWPVDWRARIEETMR